MPRNDNQVLDVPDPKVEKLEDTEPLRKAQPAVFDLASPSYRRDTELQYDELYPDRKHSWASRLSTPRYLEGKRQVVVKDADGEPVEDGAGDILVSQDREAFERRGFQQHDMSLETVAALTEEVDPITGDPVMQMGEHLVQQAAPKAPLKPAQQRMIEIKKEREKRRQKHEPAEAKATAE